MKNCNFFSDIFRKEKLCFSNSVWSIVFSFDHFYYLVLASFLWLPLNSIHILLFQFFGYNLSNDGMNLVMLVWISLQSRGLNRYIVFNYKFITYVLPSFGAVKLEKWAVSVKMTTCNGKIEAGNILERFYWRSRSCFLFAQSLPEDKLLSLWQQVQKYPLFLAWLTRDCTWIYRS